jgi:ADP-ribose pyrophosphatase YjhB (NUDIX family)
MKNHFNINNDNISIFQENALDRLIKLKKVNDNGRALRLCDFKINNNELTLCVQKAWYYDQACSNLVMDFKTDKLGDSINLREYLIKKYKKGYLPPLKTKLLANTIGIACVLMRKTDNGIIPYLVHRNKSIIKKSKDNLAVFEGGIHCSASGVLEWESSNIQNIIEGMYREVEEEIGLKKEDIDFLVPISLNRELARGGKPQIFFIGAINERITEYQLVEKRKKAIKNMLDNSRNETDKVEIKDKDVKLYKYTDVGDIINSKYEMTPELAMNLYLLDANYKFFNKCIKLYSNIKK